MVPLMYIKKRPCPGKGQERRILNGRCRSVFHYIGKINDAFFRNGFEHGITDGDGGQTVLGIGQNIVGPIGGDAEEDILENAGIADHLSEQGLIAGQDYRLCSFDGKISSTMHRPQITSVRISGLELGEKAVELLLSETPLRRIYTTAQLQLCETL